MSNDLISRSSLLEELKEQHDYIMQDPEVGKAMKWCEAVCFNRTVETVKSAPAVDAEKVFRQVGLMQEAFDMAKSTLAPVVLCKNCIHSNDAGCATGFTWCDKYDYGVTDDFYCKTGERRPDNAD